jgi:hypothetical protein
MFSNKLLKLSNIYSNDSFAVPFLVIFAFLYGSYFYFFPQESITFAKTFLGYYNYNISNTYYALGIIDSPPTIQILIPYFFLKQGINDLILNKFWGGMTSVISFLSFFYFAKLITKSNFYSIIVVFLFLGHRFIPNHFYGIYFPVNYFYFGQMGMYLCLLSISLLFLKRSKLAVTIMIINFFSHGSWALFNFIFYLIYKFVKKERFKFCIINCIIFILLFLFSLNVYLDLKKNISESTKHEIILAKKIIKENQRKDLNFLNYKKASHNPFFDLKNKYLIFDILKFYFFEILIIFTLLFNKKIKNKEMLLFFKILLFISVLISFYYFILHQWLNINYFLEKIHINIPIFIERMIITRFLNINNITVLIFFSGYFFYLLNYDNLKFPKFILSFFLVAISLSYLLHGIVISEHIPIIKIEKIFHNFTIYSLVFLVLFYLYYKNKVENFLFFFTKKILNNFFTASVAFFLLTIFFYFPFVKRNNFNTFNKDIERDLKKINNKKYNEIILSTNIHGYIDVPYLTNSPIILSGFEISDGDKINYDIYCQKTNNQFFDKKEEFYSFIDRCFESRKKSDWKKIGKALNIKYVITRSNVYPNLKLVSSNDFINVFEILR